MNSGVIKFLIPSLVVSPLTTEKVIGVGRKLPSLHYRCVEKEESSQLGGLGGMGWSSFM